jgi:hypothetical protein
MHAFGDVLIQHLESSFSIPEDFTAVNQKPPDFAIFTYDVDFIFWYDWFPILSLPDSLQMSSIAFGSLE